ncbi:MAG: tetratricopeptide repeat protein [Spirochaetales bacterium]|nr:tetratricopeptide repeat protein [Spirochaetales bacterium]
MPNLEDVVFITLPDGLGQQIEGFTFDPSIELPVQIADDSGEIQSDEGISFAMIASGLIKVMAHNPTHPHSGYYRSLLLTLQPEIVKELQLAAIARANAEDYDFAEELFSAALNLNRNEPQLFVNLALIYGHKARQALDNKEQELYDEAIERQLKTLRDGLELHANSELLLAEYGMLNLYLGNDEIALKNLNGYLKVAEAGEKRDLIEKQVNQLSERLDNEKTLYAAFDAMQMGQDERALALSETFISSDKQQWGAWFIKGWAHRRLGDFKEAQEAFLRCLELGEENADIYNELSICALELGNSDLSKEYLEIALELEDDNVKLLSNLAFIHMRDGEFNRAYELMERGLAIDPNDPAIQYLQGELTRDEE